MRTGNLFVVSGPSGAGKGTLVARLLKAVPDAWVSVSATTRKPRPGEQDGVSYYFKTRDEFEDLIKNDGLLEWAEYSGNCYGTPLQSVRDHMSAGEQVVLEIEVQGASQVKRRIPEAHLVFIAPPSYEELESRLRGRGTEDEASIKRRLATARKELALKSDYDTCIVNDDVDEAAAQLIAYVNEQAEGNR